MSNPTIMLMLSVAGQAAARDLRRFGDTGVGEAKRIGGAWREVGSELTSLGRMLGITAGGDMLRRLAVQSAQLDKDLTRIGQTAGANKGEIAGLRTELFALGKAGGESVTSLKDGLDSLAQSGLSLREAKETLRGISMATAVTGANAQTLAGGLTVAATAFQFDLSKPGQALNLLDQMTAAGRLGNAELQNLSDIFARVGVNAASAGLGFSKTLGFIEALSQLERNPERLATLADSTLRLFTNLNYLKAAQKGTGIRFFDDQGARRDPLLVLKEVKAKYDQLKTDAERSAFLDKAFGKTDLDTLKGIRALLQGETLANVDTFGQKIEDAGGTLKRDFKDATKNLIDQANRVKVVLQEAADGFATPVTNKLAEVIQKGLDSKEDGGLGLTASDLLMGGGALATGAWAWYRSRRGKSGGMGSAGNFGGLGGGSGPIPVYVVNKQLSMLPGKDGFGLGVGIPPGSVANAPKDPRSWKSLGKGLAGLDPFAVAAALMGGYELGGMANSFLGDKMGEWTDGKYKGEGAIGEWLYDAMPDGWFGKPEVNNDIQINVQIDPQNRVTTSTNDMNTKVNPSLNRGKF